MDLLQSVWGDFFTRVLPQETFEEPRQFLAFLNKMAENKVLQVHRGQLDAQKRDRHRQAPLDAAGPAAPPILDRAPTPAETAAAEDEWDWLRRQFPDLAPRLLHMLREGYSQQEIAFALGLPERTFRRVLDRMRQRLDERSAQQEAG